MVGKFLVRPHEGVEYRDSQVTRFVRQSLHYKIQKLINIKVRYQRNCYSNFTNTSKESENTSEIQLGVKKFYS